MYSPKPWLGMELNRKHKFAKGLICCLVFNESTGEKCFDLSGNDNSGTIVGADWVTDGLNFDGSSDYVDCGNIASTESRTILMRINTSSSVDSSKRLLSKRKSNGGVDSDSGYEFTLNSATGSLFYGHIGKGEVVHTLTGFLNTQIDISATYDGTTAKLYSNGNYLNNAAVSPAITNPNKLYVGNIGGFALGYDGIITYNYIYNRALLTAEVAELNAYPYQMFKPIIKPELMDYSVSAGWTGKIGGITNPAKINGVAVADITSVMRQ